MVKLREHDAKYLTPPDAAPGITISPIEDRTPAPPAARDATLDPPERAATAPDRTTVDAGEATEPGSMRPDTAASSGKVVNHAKHGAANHAPHDQRAVAADTADHADPAAEPRTSAPPPTAPTTNDKESTWDPNSPFLPAH
jgi:hypothetical protein